MHVPQDRYVKVGSINTRYWAEGDGSTVILLYGLGGFVENWLLNFEALASQHRVYAVDYVGHGRTDKPLSASYRVSDLAQFVKDFMAAVGLERAHFIGQSFGGAMTLQFAQSFPSCTDKLVLVDSAGLGKRGAFWMQLATLPLVGEVLLSPAFPSDLEEYKKSVRASVRNPAVITDELVELFYRVAVLPGRKEVLLKTLRAAGTVFGMKKDVVEPLLRGLPVTANPVLVIWGRQDQVLPLAHADVAMKSLPNARMEIVEDCGHTPMIDQPQAFNELVLSFLRG